MQNNAFISYNRRDAEQALWLASEIRKAGLTVFLDVDDLMAGKEWRRDVSDELANIPVMIVCFGASGFGDTQEDELRLGLDQERNRGSGFRIVPVLLTGFKHGSRLGHLELRTWIDLSERASEKVGLLIASIRGERPSNARAEIAAAETRLDPYPGLAAFSLSSARFFFGRDAMTDELAALVAERPFVAVVGASGSGKSSLVLAGLVRRLLAPGRAETWAAITMRPGRDPYLALSEATAAALSAGRTAVETEDAARQFHASTSRGPVVARFAAHVAKATAANARCLVVIDQLEELFTLTADQGLRERFIEEIASVVASAEDKIRVVATLRADQYPAAIGDARLGPLVASSQLTVRPMSTSELRQAIVEPARQVGFTFQEGLADTVVADMRAHEQALPLLGFLLDQLWQARVERTRMLTHEAYQELGGVARAISVHAERVYERLGPAQQEQARELLLALVRPGSGTLDSRQPIETVRLAQEWMAVVATLVDARLLVRDGRTIEIVHEELIRAWNRLQGWIGTERRCLLLRDRLADEAKQWMANGRRSDLLLPSGLRLDEAIALRRDRASLTDNPNEVGIYVEASAALAADQRAERNAQQRAMAEQTRRSNRNRWLAAGVAAIAAVLLLIVGGVSLALVDAERSRAKQGWSVALDVSRQMGTEIADGLSRTEGVPPKAVADVLGRAGDLVRKLLGGIDARDDSQQAHEQRLGEIDILKNAAEASLRAGKTGEFQLARARAEEALGRVCADRPKTAPCLNRRVGLKLLDIHRLLWESPRSAAKADLAYATGSELLRDLDAAPSETDKLMNAVLELARARVRLQIAYSRIVWVDVQTDDERKTFAQKKLTAEAIEVARACITGLSTGAREPLNTAEIDTRSSPSKPSPDVAGDGVWRIIHDDTMIELASCERVLGFALQRLVEYGDETLSLEAKDVTARSISRLNQHLAGRPDDTTAKFVVVLSKLTQGWIALNAPSRVKGNVSNGESAAAMRKGALDLLDTARADFEGLIDKNPQTFLFRNRYIEIARSFTGALESLGADVPRARLIAQQEKRAGHIRYRLQEISGGQDKSLSEPFEQEIRARRRQLAEVEHDLYINYHRDGQCTKLLDRHTQVWPLVLEAPKPDEPGMAELAEHQQQLLYWYVACARRDGRSIDAIPATLDLAGRAKNTFELLRPKDGATGPAPSKDPSALFKFFWSHAVRQLGELSYDNEQDDRMEQLLVKAKSVIEAAAATDRSNIEFEIAEGKIVASQAQRLERSGGNLADAIKLYETASQKGSEAATYRLIDLNLKGKPPFYAANKAAAARYIRVGRETPPLVETVRGASPIFPEETEFYVYLRSAKPGEDVLASELKRLDTYYGVKKLNEDSSAKLTDLVSRAREIAGPSKAPSFRHFDEARYQRSEASARAYPWGESLLGVRLKDMDALVTDRQYGRALEALEKERQALDRAVGTTELNLDRGLIGIAYLWLAEQAGGRAGDGSVAQRSKTISEEQIRLATAQSAPGKDKPETFFALSDIASVRIDVPRVAQTYNQSLDYVDRWHEVYVLFVDRGLTELYRSLTANEELRTFEWIARVECNKGQRLLSAATAIRPRNAEQSNRDARRGIEAFAAARAANAPVLRRAPGRVSALKGEIRIALELAKGQSELKENAAAVREASRARDLAQGLIDRLPTDHEPRELRAAAHEQLADLARQRADTQFQDLREVAGATKDNDDYVIKKAAKVADELKDTTKFFDLAFEDYLEIVKARQDVKPAVRADAAVDNYIRFRALQWLNAKESRGQINREIRQYIVARIKDWCAGLKEVSSTEATCLTRVADIDPAKLDDKSPCDLREGRKQPSAAITHEEILLRVFAGRSLVKLANRFLEEAKTAVGTDLLRAREAAQPCFEEALRETDGIAPNMLPLGSETHLANLKSDIAYSLMLNGDIERAFDEMNQARDISRRYNPNQPSDIAANYAHVLLLRGDSPAARKLYLESWANVWGKTSIERVSWSDQILSDLRQFSSVLKDAKQLKDIRDMIRELEASWQRG